jgi:beta-phosphoglucomutase
LIQAVLFDLDDTLVQSEKLKALSYAQAVQQVLSLQEPDQRAIEAYQEIVGSSREATSRDIMERLDWRLT